MSYISIKKAVSIYDVSDSTIRRNIKDGLIKCELVKNQYMLKNQSLESLYKHRKKQKESKHTTAIKPNNAIIEVLKQELERVHAENERLHQRLQESNKMMMMEKVEKQRLSLEIEAREKPKSLLEKLKSIFTN